jgi:hypothetical protein
MAELFKANDTIMATVKDLVAKYHPNLIGIVDEIAVVFKEKASQVGDVVVIGKTAKASPLFNILGDVPWKFIITLASDEFNAMTETERVALLDHHLCACGVEEDEQQNLKTFVKIPDVSFFKEEVERHGFWRTTGSKAKPEVIQDLFGT